MAKAIAKVRKDEARAQMVRLGLFLLPLSLLLLISPWVLAVR